MGPDLRGLLITFSLDVVVFTVCASFFLRLREERGDDERRVELSKSAAGVCGRRDSLQGFDVNEFLSSLWREHLSEVQNSDIRLYLTFLRYMACMFAVLAILGMTVVLPLNALVDGDGSTAQLWGLYVMTWVFSAVGYSFVWLFRETVRGDQWTAPTYEQQLASFTVMVRGLDLRIVDPVVVQERLKGCSKGLVACSVVRDYRSLTGANRALGAAEDRLERAEAQRRWAAEWQAARDRQLGLVGLPGQVGAHRWLPPGELTQLSANVHYNGADSYLTDEVEEEAQYRARVVVRERQRGTLRNVGICFLIFDSTQRARDQLVDSRCSKVASECGWVMLPSPPPSDIDWDNLHIGQFSQCARVVVSSVTLCLLCVLVVSPVYIIDKLHPLIDDIKNGFQEGYARMMVVAYCPPLIVLVINSMVIPFLIHHISRFDRFSLRSSQQSATLHLNIIFMVINSLIIPIMSVKSVGLLMEHMFETPVDQWNAALGASFVSSSGSFAIRYLINSSLLSTSVQLLQLPQAIYAKFLSVTAVTAAEKKRAATRWTFDFGYWYASILSIVFISMTFSLQVPLLLPCGAVYFCMKYYVDKYNFEYGVYQVDLESRGAVASVASSYLLGAVCLMQFSMSGIFVVQGGTLLGWASTALLLVPVATWALLAFRQGLEWLAPETLQSGCADVPERYADSRQLAVLKEAYTHPCDRHHLPPAVHGHYGSI